MHRSDLAPLNLFFCGASKAEVNKEKQIVEAFTQSITTDTCRHVIDNFAARINLEWGPYWKHELQKIWICKFLTCWR